ncbi:MAG: LptF/LptG family permease [Planctomycetota bacterium]|jgi:lipopolysaccharide export system permease protein
MNRLHRYLLKGFLASFLICLVSIFALYVVIDLSTNLGKFLEAGRRQPASFIAAYYLYRLPILFGKLCPLIMLLATAFTLTFMEKRNELTPIKASGISMGRLTLPLVGVGVLFALLCLALEEWVVPRAATDIYMKNLERSDPHLWNQLVHDESGSQYIFYITYYPSRARMERVYVSRVDEGMREREFLFAETCIFSDRDGGAWVLRDGYRVRYDEKGLREGPSKPFKEEVLDTHLRPSDMEHRALADEMPLSALIKTWKQNPSLTTLGVRFHFRAALPAANVLLVLLGLPIILSGAHRRYFLSALATACLGAAYFGFTFLSLRLGMNGTVPPFVAGWAPPVIFGALAAAVHSLIPT